MILAVFGTVYAVCLAILAITLLSAKPLPPSRRSGGADEAGDALRQPGGADLGRSLVATHH